MEIFGRHLNTPFSVPINIDNLSPGMKPATFTDPLGAVLQAVDFDA